MDEAAFRTPLGVAVTAVTAEEMRAVDRLAVEGVGIDLLQLMENAGRSLARHARDLRDDGPVVVAAGAGGNGGGGLACARHLANRDVPVDVVLDRDPAELSGAAAAQHRVLEADGVPVTTADDGFASAGVLVDALIGYGLRDAPRGRAAELVDAANRAPRPVLSLDVPAGVDATTGSAPGSAVRPDRTLTLALPKTGLVDVPGELVLADIGIPTVVYRRLGVPYEVPFVDEDWVPLGG